MKVIILSELCGAVFEIVRSKVNERGESATKKR